jgi:hypothetical protein
MDKDEIRPIDRWEVKLGLIVFFAMMTVGTAAAGWWTMCNFYCAMLFLYCLYAIPKWE